MPLITDSEMEDFEAIIVKAGFEEENPQVTIDHPS